MSKLRSNGSFVRLFTGRLVTNVGDSLYMIGAMWLVYELTGSPMYTGLAGFLVQIPRTLQFLVGPLVDRWPLRPVLVYSQVIQATCVLVVPVAAIAGHLSVWVVLAVMPALAFINQFVYPAQNAALPRIVNDDQLVRANSLFSMAYQSSDAIFNAASGIVIAIIGTIALFVVNAITFAIAALLFLGVVVPPSGSDHGAGGVRDDSEDAESTTSHSDSESTTRSDTENGAGSSYLADLVTGIRYIRGSAVLALVLGVMVANAAFGATLAVLPAFADLLGGPEIYGALMAAYAGGLFVGTIGSTLVERYRYGLICAVGFCWAAAALSIALVVSGWIVTVAFFFVTFVPIGTFSVLFWSMVQSAVDDRLLGRVTSITSSLAAVMLPLGSLTGGIVAERVGVVAVMGVLTVAFVLLSAYFVVNPRLRRLPPVADATETSLGLRHRVDRDSPADGA